jgi:hypothetical protein
MPWRREKAGVASSTPWGREASVDVVLLVDHRWEGSSAVDGAPTGEGTASSAVDWGTSSSNGGAASLAVDGGAAPSADGGGRGGAGVEVAARRHSRTTTNGKEEGVRATPQPGRSSGRTRRRSGGTAASPDFPAGAHRRWVATDRMPTRSPERES